MAPADPPLRSIAQVSALDVGGGAEAVARRLHNAYLHRELQSVLYVGRRRGPHARAVVRLAHERAGAAWSRFWWRMHRDAQPLWNRGPLGRFVCRATHALASPAGMWRRFRGHEDFCYPGAWTLLSGDTGVPTAISDRRTQAGEFRNDRRAPGPARAPTAPAPPELIHLHNLHGGYFDLRALPALSRAATVCWTLHDAWALTGHCAHSFDCQRWRSGCGFCPDLTIYPAVRRDATAANWHEKAAIYAASRLHVSTPCRWLMERVQRSMLAPGLASARVIPYGVDLRTFQPFDRIAARAELGLPRDHHVLLFAANGVRRNPWKDYPTLRDALRRISTSPRPEPLLVLLLGESAPPERLGGSELRFVPLVADERRMARYYQAADIYVHAARADTFPNAVLEALACGTPVVASAVGGTPEQVRAAAHPALPRDVAAATEPTGMLVPPTDSAALAASLEWLLQSPPTRERLARAATRDARLRFDLDAFVAATLDWYAESRRGHHPPIGFHSPTTVPSTSLIQAK